MTWGKDLSNLLLYGHKASVVPWGMDTGANLGSGRKQVVLTGFLQRNRTNTMYGVNIYISIYMCVSVCAHVYIDTGIDHKELAYKIMRL